MEQRRRGQEQLQRGKLKRTKLASKTSGQAAHASDSTSSICVSVAELGVQQSQWLPGCTSGGGPSMSVSSSSS